MALKKSLGVCRVDWLVLEHGPVVAFYEYGNEILHFIKGGVDFLMDKSLLGAEEETICLGQVTEIYKSIKLKRTMTENEF